MATHKNILCIICNQPIPLERKSDKYCSDDCTIVDKRVIERERNRTKAHNHIILTNDDILHDLFSEYGSEIYISANKFIEKDFNWNLNRGNTIIEGINAYKMVRYAYTLFNNQTLRIWKL